MTHYSYALTLFFIFQTGILAETNAPAKNIPTKGVSIAVLQGEGVVNPLPRPPETRISIRVADAQGTPVTGAVAVFELPEAGASAHFGDGSQVKVVLTDRRGEASAPIKSNEVPGRYEPTITVNYLGQTSRLTLHQENRYPYGSPAKSKLSSSRGLLRNRWFRIGLVGAAAGAAAIVLTRGHSTATPSGPGGIVITPGTGSVGGR